MRMGQADPEMVAVGGDEHLRLVAQTAEGDRVDDPVAVALEDVARPARTVVVFLDGPGRAILTGLRGEVGPEASSGLEFLYSDLGRSAGPAKAVDAVPFQAC